MINRFARSLFKLAVLTAPAVLLLALPISAAPPPVASSPCDTNYYSSLKARAWLEAQREITQNQNLIFKPDSVLEYTCFDGYMRQLAGSAPALFSENARWGAAPGLETRMDNALQAVVGTALEQYIDANFPHEFLAGRSGINHQVTPISGGDYACNQMNEVWKKAQCMNFASDLNTDGFYTLADYAAGPDRRSHPGPACANAAEWSTNVSTATGASTPWTRENVVTYLDQLSPSTCSSSPKLATGIMVKAPRQTPEEYPEKICIAPGCHYDGGNDTCM